MCNICRRFKKGSLTIEEARLELEEQAELLGEEHIEDIEEMLSESEEDVYDYISERQSQYDLEEVVEQEEEELPLLDEEYDLGEEDN
jgi:hypothetical protein